MAGLITWNAGSPVVMLSTELNALANNTASTLGTAFDNSSGKYFFGAFQLAVTFTSAPSVDTTVDLYLVPAIDGTNYGDGGVGVTPQNHIEASFVMRAVTSLQRIVIRDITLPPCPFKIFVFANATGPFPATGSTVTLLPYNQAYT